MISILTPTHNANFLTEAYESLKEQTYQDWEWIILPNGALRVVQDFNDPRVKIQPYAGEIGMVGTLKRLCADAAQGDILVEFDHDDLLTPDCLDEVYKAFEENPDAIFVYSNFSNIDMNWMSSSWSEVYGWKQRPFEYKSHALIESVSADPNPSDISRIWFAPNHVRAWKTKEYKEMGGHANMKISDDHDLLCRTYLKGKMVHIDKCLYIYRVHGKNTWLQTMDEIDKTMWQNHDKYIFDMMKKWADDKGLRKLDLGGGIDSPTDLESVDLQNANIIANLNLHWPFEDSSVGVIRAHDVLEHLSDPIHAMNEAYRSLAHGGMLFIQVPSTDGAGAWCDPTHVSFWNKRSFRYYTEKNIRRYIEPACNCRFQVVKLIDKIQYDNIPYVEAQLIAVKEDQPRFYGALNI